ncbi:MAG: hypothetical protein ACI9CE_003326 [Flavobacterium sp.]|jgi:hypothetical protein
MILAPILAILPSAEQKDQLKKRKLAMAKGVRVQLTHVDDPDPDPSKYLSNTGQPLDRKLPIVAYRLARPRPEMWHERPAANWGFFQARETSISTVVDYGVTGWHCDQSPQNGFSPVWEKFFQEKLPRLPRDVIRVEENKFMVTIYWKEKGEVDEVLDFLCTCTQLEFDN